MVMRFFSITCFLNCSTNQITEIEELSGDLVAHIESIARQMPGRASEGFVKPTASQLNNWRDLIVLFLDGNLREVQSIINAEFPFYRLLRYKDIRIDEYKKLKHRLINKACTDIWELFISSNLAIKLNLTLGSTSCTFKDINDKNDIYVIFDDFCKSYTKRAWKFRSEIMSV